MAPYQELLRDTAVWLQPTVGQRWLDLGCGAGQLSRLLWDKSQGRVEAIVGVDLAKSNDKAYAELRAQLQPTPTPACLRFVARDFTKGFSDWPSMQFDGVVSGLALQFAEAYSRDNDCWTELGYDQVLSEAQRLLKWGGVFVFSVNVPNPAWSKVALPALAGAFGTGATLASHENRLAHVELRQLATAGIESGKVSSFAAGSDRLETAAARLWRH